MKAKNKDSYTGMYVGIAVLVLLAFTPFCKLALNAGMIDGWGSRSDPPPGYALEVNRAGDFRPVKENGDTLFLIFKEYGSRRWAVSRAWADADDDEARAAKRLREEKRGPWTRIGAPPPPPKPYTIIWLGPTNTVEQPSDLERLNESLAGLAVELRALKDEVSRLKAPAVPAAPNYQWSIPTNYQWSIPTNYTTPTNWFVYTCTTGSVKMAMTNLTTESP